MSEQPETWRTDPRERLIASIDSTWAYCELGATPEQLVDAFAHELAEKLRREADDLHQTEPGVVKGLRIGADLIDPSGAGPVRPDEEPT
jgi:hypothetical protein